MSLKSFQHKTQTLHLDHLDKGPAVGMQDIHEGGVRLVYASVAGLVVEERAGRVEAWGARAGYFNFWSVYGTSLSRFKYTHL